ncbi:unnamed protein product [Aspergillus oryzae]|uniref:Unnamed protein product n=2 Tax=Aspergillus oryzae TaxID=5062 RepID=A0AAN5BTH4_ASPOZ|nr:unnamed protein product [Aspergillus oryzae]GMF96506.1 unnamed protein product [Aspergillus oryzae]GMG12753.1 unnamed protein product [Aspergillus oryzae]GMG31923.1 unnamed protein product [Aspergillus oryzae]GMG53897.1 unnamed protein product [Aspergillus oryzae var. brunneus]
MSAYTALPLLDEEWDAYYMQERDCLGHGPNLIVRLICSASTLWARCSKPMLAPCNAYMAITHFTRPRSIAFRSPTFYKGIGFHQASSHTSWFRLPSKEKYDVYDVPDKRSKEKYDVYDAVDKRSKEKYDVYDVLDKRSKEKYDVYDAPDKRSKEKYDVYDVPDKRSKEKYDVYDVPEEE